VSSTLWQRGEAAGCSSGEGPSLLCLGEGRGQAGVQLRWLAILAVQEGTAWTVYLTLRPHCCTLSPALLLCCLPPTAQATVVQHSSAASPPPPSCLMHPRSHPRSGLFQVGPESARAHPGPVCYKKGGHLAITDANLVLGRILPAYFPNIFGPQEVGGWGARGVHEATGGVWVRWVCVWGGGGGAQNIRGCVYETTNLMLVLDG
jgi:hypothetical protein